MKKSTNFEFTQKFTNQEFRRILALMVSKSLAEARERRGLNQLLSQANLKR